MYIYGHSKYLISMTYDVLILAETPGKTRAMDRRLQDRIAGLAWGETGAAAAPTRGLTDYSVELLGYDAGSTGAASRAASAWRERWFRLWKRSQLPAKLIAFFDDLNQAEAAEQVSASVADHALQTVGGYKAVVFLPRLAEDDGPSSATSLLRASRFGQPGLVAAPDFREVAEAWWAELGAFLGDPQVTMVAHVPFGDRGVLLVAERRADRVFDADDWEVLATLAEQGDRALARLRMIESAYELSLTDPLTGLANRRQMDVVLRHAWAAAERGEGLAVMMLDLDGFKGLNDAHGHSFGDQILGIAAECLREEARGADAVIRYGGDEFLVIMPRGTATGGKSLASRVRHRLHGWVGVSAGVAEYHPSYLTPMDLIDAADADLYRNKALRGFDRPHGSISERS
jgi:diguanylate cyclase (GGDEF)-like protein